MSATWQRYDPSDIHKRLIEQQLSNRWREVEQVGSQALHCTYYVPLQGDLGSDWGVIVNPESSRFGMLTFEHDDCGCPKSDTEDEEGWGRHNGPTQDGDMWSTRWYHECEPGWCEKRCDEKKHYGKKAMGR